MKNWTPNARLFVALSALSCLPLSAALAADTAASPQVVVTDSASAAPSAVPAPAAQTTTPSKLPYGMDDVLKLSRARVSDDIIQSYVQNSGTIYNLSANDIVYLRSQGLSDRVVTAMLDQRNRLAGPAAQTAAAPVPAAAPTYDNAQAAAAGPQSQATYTQSAPASSLYVIPYPQATAPYYYDYGYPYGYSYWPYYGGYYSGYYGPSISLGFGFGRGWGSSHGGYHGGGFRGGGGFHGGAGFHGGGHR